MKPKLFVDFDSTVCKSIKAFCEVYNRMYQYRGEFTPADWTKVNQYDFSDQCPLLEDGEAIANIFASKHFFRKLQFMPNAKEVLYELHKDYQITIVSLGSHTNLARKSMWLYQHLEFVKDLVLLSNEDNKMCKSIVDMRGGILIDDVASNLNSSSAATKICFGREYPWNKSFDGLRLRSWDEVYEYLQR